MIRCSVCGTVCTGTDWHCTCGGPLEVVEDSIFEIEKLENVHSLWRYKKYVGTENSVSFNEGMTPLISVDDYYYKLDFLFPTSSFKDRGTTVHDVVFECTGDKNNRGGLFRECRRISGSVCSSSRNYRRNICARVCIQRKNFSN